MTHAIPVLYLQSTAWQAVHFLLYFCGLFYNTVSIADYTASMAGRWVKDKLKRVWREAALV